MIESARDFPRVARRERALRVPYRQGGMLVRLALTAALASLAACSAEVDSVAEAASGAAPAAVSDAASLPLGKRGTTRLDPAKLPEGVIALGRIVIPDPGVIAQGPALSALIPLGWRSEGGVTAPRGGCSEPYLVNWTAVSADGRSALGIFPTEIWQWSTYPIQSPCPNWVLRSAREYLQAKAQQLFPGARALDYRDRPDFTRSAAEHARRLVQTAQSVGLRGVRAHAEGGELLFAFERDGTEMRGVIGVTAVFQGMHQPNPLDGSVMEATTASTLGTFVAYAPNGRLDFDLIEASRRSISPDAGWLERLFALQGEIGRANVQATRERAAIIVAGGAEATRRNIETYKQMARTSVQNSRDSIALSEQNVARAQDVARNREMFPGDATGDRMQRERIEGIRGVETYHDPVDGRQVQLDANYEHAWRVKGQEAYILTRDPNFNPGQYGIEAAQMGVVK